MANLPGTLPTESPQLHLRLSGVPTGRECGLGTVMLHRQDGGIILGAPGWDSRPDREHPLTR